jgi:hypothetical protein
VSVGWDIDPAKLMGWADGRVQYQALVDVTAGGVSKTIWLPITEKQEVIRQGEVVGLTHGAAGTPRPTGYTRVPARRVLQFKGDGQPIKVRIRISSGGSLMPLKAIHSVLVEVKGRSEWTPPAEASGTQTP